MKRKRHLKAWSIKLALLVGSTALALLVAEVGLRLLPPPPHGYVTHQKLFVEYDSLLGWRLVPGYSGVHTHMEYSTHESFNSHGLRGPEYAYDKPPGIFRILALGDSFAEGYTVSFDSVFSEVLQRELNPGFFRHVQVLNAGTGGYSTDQEVLFFETEGRRYEPDLTILLFYANDVWYNARTTYWRGAKPRFVLQDGELELTNVPVPPPSPDTASPSSEAARAGAAADSVSSSALHTVKAWLGEHSRLYALFRDWVKSQPRIQSVFARVGLTGAPAKTPTPPPVPGPWKVWRTDPDAETESAWDVTERLLVRLDEQVEEAGGRLLIFLVPWKASIYSERWNRFLEQYGVSEELWSPDAVGDRLRQISREHDLDLVDPTPSFRRHARSGGEPLYFKLDEHWNSAGHRLAGEILAREIRARLPSPPSRRSARR